MFTFVSPIHNYRLVIKPSYQEVVNGVANTIYGVKVKFVQGRFETDDENLAERIRNSRSFFDNKIFEETTEKVKVEAEDKPKPKKK